MSTKRIIVGISGASGFALGETALRLLRPVDIEVHLVMSASAERTRQFEIEASRAEIEALADVMHDATDIGASIASGSFETEGMLVAPCSMRTLAAVAHGFSDTLLTRAADVVLKERRPLVLMARETPLNLAHIDNMRRVTEMGAIVCPPVPAFYAQPRTVDDIVRHSVTRALSLLGVAVSGRQEWMGETTRPQT